MNYFLNTYDVKMSINYDTLIQVHGSLMSIAFLILLPIGILLALFGKSMGRKWFVMHWIFNGILAGSCIFVSFIIVIYAHVKYNLTTHFSFNFHSIFGLIIVLLVYIQISAGIIVHFYDRTKILERLILIFHKIFGRLIFIFGIINIYYGLMFYKDIFDTSIIIPIITYSVLVFILSIIIITLYTIKIYKLLQSE